MLFFIFFILALIFEYNSFFFVGTLLLLIFLIIFPFLRFRLCNEKREIVLFLPILLFLVSSLRDGSSSLHIISLISFSCLFVLLTYQKEKVHFFSILLQSISIFLLNLFLEWNYLFLYFTVLMQVAYLSDRKKIQASTYFIFSMSFIAILVFLLCFKEISFQKYYAKDLLLWISIIFLIFRTHLNIYTKLSLIIVSMCVSLYSSSPFFSIFSIGSYIYTTHIFRKIIDRGEKIESH